MGSPEYLDASEARLYMCSCESIGGYFGMRSTWAAAGDFSSLAGVGAALGLFERMPRAFDVPPIVDYGAKYGSGAEMMRFIFPSLWVTPGRWDARMRPPVPPGAKRGAWVSPVMLVGVIDSNARRPYSAELRPVELEVHGALYSAPYGARGIEAVWLAVAALSAPYTPRRVWRYPPGYTMPPLARVY